MKTFKQFHESLSEEDLDIIENLLENHKQDRIYFTNNNQIPKDLKVKQINDINYPPKPKGLWYSSGNEWLKFIKYDYVQKAKDYSRVYSLDIDLSKMLIIDTEEKFKAFEKEYVRTDSKYGDMLQNVFWKDVSDNYGGIEISPYFPQFRMTSWYYPWDVASGCIWDFSLIKNTTLLFEK